MSVTSITFLCWVHRRALRTFKLGVLLSVLLSVNVTQVSTLTSPVNRPPVFENRHQILPQSLDDYYSLRILGWLLSKSLNLKCNDMGFLSVALKSAEKENIDTLQNIFKADRLQTTMHEDLLQVTKNVPVDHCNMNTKKLVC